MCSLLFTTELTGYIFEKLTGTEDLGPQVEFSLSMRTICGLLAACLLVI